MLDRSTVGSTSRRSRGVTRIEALVAGCLVLALAGVVAPVAGMRTPAEQSEAIVDLCHSLERATFRHYVDTRTTAAEFSTHGGDVESYHQLSHGRGNPRWSGPYLDSPLGPESNPCGGDVFLYPDLKGGIAHPQGGFDPTGSGSDTVSGRGQFVAFMQVPEDVAAAVDRELDRTRRGVAWSSTGRCEYDFESRTLCVLVLEY
jgi:hypothetical protein